MSKLKKYDRDGMTAYDRKFLAERALTVKQRNVTIRVAPSWGHSFYL